MKVGYVYILSNFKRTSLYVGMTNDIERRMLEHKAGFGSVHSARYNLKYLMHFEECPSIGEAIIREKNLKNWHKDWKWNLVKENNPELKDLAEDWFDEEDIRSVLRN